MLSTEKSHIYGREMMAHRWVGGDSRDYKSTRVIAHENGFPCNVWELHQFEGDVYRIMLSDDSKNKSGTTWKSQQYWILNA